MFGINKNEKRISIHRIIKVSRTIADLEGSKDIKEAHLAEALQYRPKEDIIGIV